MARENQGYKEAQCFEEWSLLEDQWHFDAQNGVHIQKFWQSLCASLYFGTLASLCSYSLGEALGTMSSPHQGDKMEGTDIVKGSCYLLL